ncbi:amino acid adenylation domain-containing protein, partial [Pedobacter terrae]
AYVPIDPAYPKERIDFIIKDTNAKILITDIDTEQKISLQEQGCQKAILSEIVKKQYQEHSLKPRPQDIAYIIYTSGSTGKPKGVMVRHDSLLNRLNWAQEFYKLDATDKVLQKTTYCFDVSVWELIWPLLTGSSLCFAEPDGHKDTAYLKNIIDVEQITTIHFVPSMLEVFLFDIELDDCPSLKRILCSGEALRIHHADLFHKKFTGVSLFNLYGPTEAAIDVTNHEILPDSKILLGRAMPNINLYVLDAARNPVPFGVPGELFIAGVQVAEGYLNRPELTRQRFIPDHIEGKGQLYQTGDMVVMQPDGLLEYLGRIDDQVKIRGFRIEPAEIEQAIMEIEGIQQAVVVTVKDPQQRDRLAAYLVCQEMDKQAITDALSIKLPTYMVPASFTKLEQIPLTPNGKIDKNRLPSPETSTQKQGEHAPPTDKTQELLCQIWQELLGISQIGIY